MTDQYTDEVAQPESEDVAGLIVRYQRDQRRRRNIRNAIDWAATLTGAPLGLAATFDWGPEWLQGLVFIPCAIILLMRTRWAQRKGA